MTIDLKEIVKNGYDKASYAYRADTGIAQETWDNYFSWIEMLKQLIPAGSDVLDLGCGCGLPAARLLAESFKTTGVDISPVQIERARKLVPEADFICADFVTLAFPPDSFNAIAAFYSIIHVPLPEQEPLFINIFSWLKKGGVFLLTIGHTSWTGTEENWLGVNGAQMYWSHLDVDSYLYLLVKTGFTVIDRKFIPEGNSGHDFIVCQKLPV